MNLTVHNVYFCFSEVGCTISLRDGTPCKEVPAHTPTLFVAQQPDMGCSDPAAVVKEIPNGLQLLHGQMMKEQAAGGLPAGYTQVEYLESTGAQYITKVETLQSAYAEYVSQFNTIAGAATEYKAMYFGFNAAAPIMGQTWDGKWVDYGTPADLEKHTFKLRADMLNDTQYYSQIDDMPIINRSLGLHNGLVGISPFSLHNSPYKARLKNFSTKIWNADELVHELIPALDPTGAPCLYDIVTRTAFYNAGTDDFLYPAERTTYALRRVLPDWGKLTEHGLRRLYHAPANYKGEPYDYAMENGFKPIVETEQPEEGYWIPEWHEREDCIELEWVETEPPMDEPLTATE